MIALSGAAVAHAADGGKAPDFTATGAESKKVRLADYRGKKNVILIFGRAHW